MSIKYVLREKNFLKERNLERYIPYRGSLNIFTDKIEQAEFFDSVGDAQEARKVILESLQGHPVIHEFEIVALKIVPQGVVV